MNIVLEYLPLNIQHEILKHLSKNSKNDIEEIRIRANRPIILKTELKNIMLEYTATSEDIFHIFQKICENSIYSYKKQICDGYITIKNGHRVGIVGNCVLENNSIININHISSLNFRIAKEKRDCSKEFLNYILNFENKEIYNTLIVARPGAGKTTILRDLIRKISNGITEYKIDGKTCGVVDERGEIASMFKGQPQNDIGILTDVIDNVPKSKGMTMLVRSMAPEVIACDEIGTKEDVEAINYAVCSGVKGIFTAHGSDFQELILNPKLEELLKKKIIEKVIFLDSNKKGKIKEVYKIDKEKMRYVKEA